MPGQGARPGSPPGPGRGGGRGRGELVDDLFPHPWKLEKRSKICGQCLEDIQGVAYAKAYRKLCGKAKQCQKCQKVICDDHIMIICRQCVCQYPDGQATSRGSQY